MKALVVFVFMLLVSTVIMGQVFQSSQLSVIIKKSNIDSVQKIERIAALKFHNLINQYRKKNKTEILVWDDTLWLTSRNHNMWMSENNKLTHSQTNNTKFFTGETPSERYDYVTTNKGGSSWSGENALYNFDNRGNTIEEISSNMAEAAFNQWRGSAGHDRNMRAPQSHSHGTAFFLDPDGTVWATDLFSSQLKTQHTFAIDKDISPANNTSVFKNPNTKNEKVKKIRSKDAEQLKSDLLSLLESNSTVKTRRSNKKAAQRHANYLSFSKQLSHKEEKNKTGFYATTEKKRMLKASLGWYFFQQQKTPISESVAHIELMQIPVNISQLAHNIDTDLNSEKKLKGTSLVSGYGVAIRVIKNILNIYVVRVERVIPEEQLLSHLNTN